MIGHGIKILEDTYFDQVHSKIWNYRAKRIMPSDWTEQNVYLTSEVSPYVGKFSYDRSPYTREIIDNLSATSPIDTVAVMKCAQSGLTQGVIMPGICWIIAENPAPTLFMAGDKDLAKDTITGRLDPMIDNSGISHLIRANKMRGKNQRTGDTSTGKEFSGGFLVVHGTKNADKMRFYSVKNIFADDWDAAPRDDKKEGSTQKLVETRATAFALRKKINYISTPTEEQTSNILPIYLKGDQRKWHWKCPHCHTRFPVEWRVKREDGSYSGIKWKLDKNGELIRESVHYECPICGGKIYQTQKYALNLGGKWIPTAKPHRPEIRSYHINAVFIPPGFTTWVDLVYEWLAIYPSKDVVDIGKLKTFLNTRLGQTWKDEGETPRINQLMKNICSYQPGTVPDVTCEKQGHGNIIMLTLACDLNGVMEENNQDVRLDWELVAHTTTGATYSVDHGSIGTFKRTREKTQQERQTDADREKWTYHHGHYNSVWPEFEKIIRTQWPTESGERTMSALITLVDTGNFTRSAFTFINSINDVYLFGIKGEGDINYRRTTKDTRPVRLSKENNRLYLLEVNQIKDELSGYIKLRKGNDGYQPPGYMNFPQPTGGKYILSSFFEHFESEKRVEEIKDGNVIGFKWVKRSNQSKNHFWDVRVYNQAAPYVYLDLLGREDKQLKNLSWAEFVGLLNLESA